VVVVVVLGFEVISTAGTAVDGLMVDDWGCEVGFVAEVMSHSTL